MGRNLQDMLHLIICLVMIPAGTNTSCGNGNYLDGGTCKPCLSECIYCSSMYYCTNCIAGHYGRWCQFTCTNCKQNVCNLSNGGCDQGCDSGYYGWDCSNRCKDEGNYRNGGTCSPCVPPCTKCSSRTQCTECLTGRYGTSCLSTCTTCKQNVCDMSGVCAQGCDSGYYGDYCTYSCRHPCITCTSSTDCQSCTEVNYLSSSMCYPCHTSCATCTGSGSSQCAACKDEGTYLEDGTCSSCVSPCTKCSSRTQCTECLTGHYGTSCQSTCTACKDNICGMSGVCTHGCVTGHWNNTCENLCSDGCLNSTCGTSTGHCVDGCLREYYGESCDFRCSDDCLDVEVVTDANLCRREGGACLGGCVAGYYGDTCGEASESADKQLASVIGPALGGGIGLFVTIVGVTICILYRKGYRINKPGNASQKYTGTTHENDVEVAENHDDDSSSNGTGNHEYESPTEYEMTERRREDNVAPYDVLQLPDDGYEIPIGRLRGAV